MHAIGDADNHGPQLTILAQDAISRAVIPRSPQIHLLSSPHPGSAQRARNVFVFTPATQLSEVAKFASAVNGRHQLRALFVRDDVGPYWVPALFERAGLRTLRNTIIHSSPAVPLRVLRAWMQGAQGQLIADAKVVAGRLFVVGCDLRKYDLPLARVAALKGVPPAELNDFQVDEDGSYLHWPGPDLHLDLDAIRVALDPSLGGRARRARAIHDARYGKAIAQVRQEAGLTQTDIPGLSARQVRRIEKGANVTARALSDLAHAHGLSLGDYLDRLARELQATAGHATKGVVQASQNAQAASPAPNENRSSAPKRLNEAPRDVVGARSKPSSTAAAR